MITQLATYKMFYNAVVSAEIGHEVSVLRTMCPDQYVGNIYQYSDLSGDFPTRINADLICGARNKILLILESPHNKEFVGVPGPAKGKTGNLIRKHLLQIVENDLGEHCEVFLVNAVQYQCSLGYAPKLYRDRIFRKSWASFARQCFAGRLELLCNNMPTLVINACTTGKKLSGTPTLQDLVEDAIRERLGRHSDLLLNHPSSWWATRNRKKKSIKEA